MLHIRVLQITLQNARALGRFGSLIAKKGKTITRNLRTNPAIRTTCWILQHENIQNNVAADV